MKRWTMPPGRLSNALFSISDCHGMRPLWCNTSTYKKFVNTSWKEQSNRPSVKCSRIGCHMGLAFKGQRLDHRFTKGSNNAHVKKLRNGIGAWIHQSNREIWVPISVRPMKEVNTNSTDRSPAANSTVRMGIGELLIYERMPERKRIFRTALLDSGT
ncbi:MAG: hypothetical protein KF843_09935 [Flavobacteriales bacterium]|nr:hypothetical protein [Flavobacteriales bacterium]